jgi:inorganic triphosphatase YgiF
LREIELKLLLDTRALARLPKTAWAGRSDLAEVKRKRLRSTYFDTPDLALKAAGFTLRVREAGAKQIQTVKAKPRGTGLALDRAEYESPVGASAALPDLGLLPEEVAGAIEKLCGAAPPRPVFTTDIRRRTAYLKTPDALIELALDEGAILAGAEKEPLRELELELKEGAPLALYREALALLEEVPLRLSLRSKAERGFRIASGGAISPVKAGPIELEATATAGEALEAALSSALSQILANEPAIMEAGDPEGIHQMRVGLRRLRAMIGLLGDRSEELNLLSSKAKEYAAILGEARDLDVFEEEILSPVAALDLLDVDLAPIVSALKRARKAAWTHVRTALSEPEFTKFLLTLACEIEALREAGKGGDLGAAAREAGAARLEKAAAKAGKLGRKFAALPPPARHELRKRLKKLRYAAQVFEPLFKSGQTAPYLTHLGALQDSLGALNDVAAAEETLARLPVAAQHRTAAAKAGGFILGYHGRRAEQDLKAAEKLWKKFAKAPRFWQG